MKRIFPSPLHASEELLKWPFLSSLGDLSLYRKHEAEPNVPCVTERDWSFNQLSQTGIFLVVVPQIISVGRLMGHLQERGQKEKLQCSKLELEMPASKNAVLGEQ